MILLRCSNCGQTLEIDDAFAGGVCRCRHCGTIQTVPADAPRGEAGQAAEGSKPLYRREEQAGGTSGLDQLADVLASSGMLSSGLQRTARRGGKSAGKGGPKPAPPRKSARKPADRRLTLAIGLAAILFLLAAGLAVALLTRGSDAGDAVPGQESAEERRDSTFAGLPLGRRVVFVLDRGTQTQPSLRALNDAVLDAVRRMPVTSQFQVIYWANADTGADLGASEIVSIPGQSPRDASDANRDALEKGMVDVISGGSTDALPAVELALRTNPDTIVLASGKAWQLGGDFAEAVLSRVRDRGEVPTIHTLAVGNASDGPGEPMQAVARETGGRFVGLTTNRLRDLVKP